MRRDPWFRILRPVSKRRGTVLYVISFMIPLIVWSAVSYLPFLWHPLIEIEHPGGVAWFKPGQLVEKSAFRSENAKALAAKQQIATGSPANPVFLPAPHEVARAFYTAFATKPVLRGDVWLHESLWRSIKTIFWGFILSCAFGIPLGILCGSYGFWSRISEPAIDFIRYMPAPAFGALAVAILGIHEAPKIAIIFIGTFFQQVLVVANTIRRVDPTLIEAAQTLGAKGWRLITKVVVPAKIAELYTDTRILLGWAWTYLIVAEVVGVSSGITYFINQQAKYRNFDNVYAAIVIIGFLGLGTDQILGFLGRRLFPWENPRPSRIRNMLGKMVGKSAPAATTTTSPIAAN